MGKTKLQAHHTLRFISVGVFIIVLFAIAISFLTRSKRQVQVPEIAAKLEEQKIDKKEGLEVREVKGNEEVANITADKHYIGEDNLYHLEGNVRISLSNRIEGEDVIIRGEKGIHDSEWSYLWLQGQTAVEFKDLVVESPVLEYDVQRNVFKSDQTIRFSSETILGSAQKCNYFLRQKKAELRGKVHLKLLPSQKTAVPVEIDTEYFEYFVGKGRGKTEGGVELTHGKSRATAGLLAFELSAGRQQIKSLFLKENVKIFLVDEFKKGTPFSDQEALALYGDVCQIQAGEVHIKGFVDLPQIQRLEAAGKCSFRFISETGSFTQMEGNEISFSLSKKGTLKELFVYEKASITEEDKEKGFQRYIDGQSVQIQGDKNVLFVEGKDTLKARIRSEDSEITAQKIRLFLENNDMEANEDTKVIIYSQKRSKKTIGFFSKENPVFITAKDMRYSEEKKRFMFNGGTKIWQTKETIKAREISFDVETGAFQARGGVESILPYQPKDREKEQNVRIESASTEYDPEKNLIVYKDKEKVILKARDVVLTAKLLTIALEKESGDMMDIEASNNVVVMQETYEGQGEKARFDVKEEIITIVGNSVLIDKDKGRTEGGKLTFYMADGRIVVENKDRERSITVIKF